jgi:hypothetical protein
VKLLGVNTESLALTIVAVVASFLLAVAVWLGRWPRVTMLAVAAFGLVFAAGDARELVHQLNESNVSLATTRQSSSHSISPSPRSRRHSSRADPPPAEPQFPNLRSDQ